MLARFNIYYAICNILLHTSIVQFKFLNLNVSKSRKLLKQDYFIKISPNFIIYTLCLFAIPVKKYNSFGLHIVRWRHLGLFFSKLTFNGKMSP